MCLSNQFDRQENVRIGASIFLPFISLLGSVRSHSRMGQRYRAHTPISLKELRL